jgi:hypothetical protein
MSVDDSGMGVHLESCAFYSWQGLNPAHTVPGRGEPQPKRAAREKGHAMAMYLISFPSDAMDEIPEEEMPNVAKASHAVCTEAIDAGVYVLAGGLEDQPASIVATDGTVTDGPNPDVISGVTIVDVPSREEALKWAGKVAAACRCTQEVREIGFDPELDAMLREAASRRRRHDDA